MTKDEYQTLVDRLASDALQEFEYKQYKTENPDDEFWKFMDKVNYDGSFHEYVDSHFQWNSWLEAANEVLANTNQDPDAVDQGLYEGCSWQKIIIVIAYQCFEDDIHHAMEAVYDGFDPEEEQEPEEPREPVPYVTTDAQIGYYPKTRRFRLLLGMPEIICISSDMVKVRSEPYTGHREPRRRGPEPLTVVFAGRVRYGDEERPISEVKEDVKHNCAYVYIDARRVYVQAEGRKIEDDLEECKNSYYLEDLGETPSDDAEDPSDA